MGIRFCLIFQSQCPEVNVSHLLVYEKKKKKKTPNQTPEHSSGQSIMLGGKDVDFGSTGSALGNATCYHCEKFVLSENLSFHFDTGKDI